MHLPLFFERGRPVGLHTKRHFQGSRTTPSWCDKIQLADDRRTAPSSYTADSTAAATATATTSSPPSSPSSTATPATAAYTCSKRNGLFKRAASARTVPRTERLGASTSHINTRTTRHAESNAYSRLGRSAGRSAPFDQESQSWTLWPATTAQRQSLCHTST